MQNKKYMNKKKKKKKKVRLKLNKLYIGTIPN